MTKSFKNLKTERKNRFKGAVSWRTKVTISVLVLLFLVSTIAAAQAETYTFVTKWGGYGSGDGEFSYTGGVAVDNSGYVYVIDVFNYRVQKFTSTGVFVTQWGSYGSGDGEFRSPVGVAVDNSGYVYVADDFNGCVQKFTSTGEFVAKWGTDDFPVGEFGTPVGVAVDSSGYVYITEMDYCRVQKFTSTGVCVTKWGTNGVGDGQFSFPADVAVDNSGYVYVTDNGNNRVQKFTNTGEFVTKWGSYGSEDGQFSDPEGVAVDNSGYVYVTDYANYRVQKFTNNGVFVTQWGSRGTGNGQFNAPVSVAVDSSGYIYVADNGNWRVQKFASNTQSVSTATGSGIAIFTSSAGAITNLNAVSEGTLPTSGKPTNLVFPHGMFSFTITGLSSGQTVTVDIQLPSNVPVGSQYWKYQTSNGWFSMPISSDDGDNKITLTLTDGSTGDSDGIANGVIVDPGGLGIAQFTLSLSSGWNMVSFPVLPADTSLTDIFNGKGYYQVLTWTGTSYTTPTNVEAGKGYWILVLSPTTINLEGMPVNSYSSDLSSGWSMIGSVNGGVVNCASVFLGYYQMLTWTGTSYITATTIEPGKGYWALVLNPLSITVHN
jgi:DNA-binding beta-propeller fold protein YncE